MIQLRGQDPLYLHDLGVHYNFEIVFAGTTSPNPFDMNELGGSLTGNGTSASSASTGAKPKIVQSLLGEHSNLVNLDNLVSSKDTG